MEGFGCDPAKIVAKDKTSQVKVSHFGCQSMSKHENSTCRQAERTQRAGDQGMWSNTDTWVEGANH